nr:hypothetical protein [Tanacetum cinerariifolium]
MARFDKSKVECFNCHKMGHFARECRAPRSQDKGRRDNYSQGSKVEEQAPKALMAIDRVGWDWSFMANKEENHALVADEEAPTKFSLMAKTSAECEVFDNSLCSKTCKKNTDSLNIEKKFKEYDQKLEALSTINVPDAIEESVEAKVLTKMKKQLPTHVPKAGATFIKPRLNNNVLEVMKNNQINLFTTPLPTTTNDLLEMKLKIKLYNRIANLKERPHDDQDPRNDREGKKRNKRKKDGEESSSRSLKKDKAPMDYDQDEILIDKTQDKEEELIQKHPNTKWFFKKSGSVDAIKRKYN